MKIVFMSDMYRVIRCSSRFTSRYVLGAVKPIVKTFIYYKFERIVEKNLALSYDRIFNA